MTDPAEMTRLQASLRRQWIIVVAAALIGLIVAWMLANHGSSTYWKATQMVTVSTLPGGINNTSKSQIFLTAASMPSVLRTAEAKLGLAHGKLTGKVSSVLVTSDQSTSSISVRADSRAAAVPSSPRSRLRRSRATSSDCRDWRAQYRRRRSGTTTRPSSRPRRTALTRFPELSWHVRTHRSCGHLSTWTRCRGSVPTPPAA